jgi:hypothetical protein
VENVEPINRSAYSVKVKIFTLGISAFLIALFSSWLLWRIFKLVGPSGYSLIFFVWVLMIGAWGLGSLKLWGDWLTEYYELTPESIILHKKEGKGGKSQEIYRYESIISVRMIQNEWGVKHNYGDVYLTIPKIDKELVLKDIENPLTQLEAVKNRIDSKPGNHNLIT